MLLPPPEESRVEQEAGVDGAKVQASAAHQAPADKPLRRKRPRVDWAALQRHTFGCDVWQCPCGGRRRVVAVVTNAATAEALLRNLGLWQKREPPPAAQGPPQRELVLDS